MDTCPALADPLLHHAVAASSPAPLHLDLQGLNPQDELL